MKRIAMLVTLIAALASCKAASRQAPREVASADEVRRAGEAFKQWTAEENQAWLSGDVAAVRAIYTEDIVHHDGSFGAHIVGIEDVAEMAANFMLFFPQMGGRIAGTFIGADKGLDIWEMWDIGLGGYEFTQDDPLQEVDLLEISGDRVSSWTLYYSLDTLEKTDRAPAERIEEARALLTSYELAWSSGDARSVESLYAPDAVYEDTIFDRYLEGGDSIGSFAKSFFAWYPDVQWKLSMPFGEGRTKQPVTGAVFTITAGGPDGEPCDVLAAVILETSDDWIAHEAVYYEPDSLIACGWAQ